MPDHHLGPALGFFDVAAPLAAVLAVLGYLVAVAASRVRPWPRHRTALWVLGVLTATAAVTGPLAQATHHSFTAHMVAHVMLGMLAPLLLVLAAPATLLLRAVPVRTGRIVSRILRSVAVRVLTDPIVAAVINVGGLWVLYTTSVHSAMHTNPSVHVLVHLHMVIAGYLFTVAVVGVDPMPPRRSYPYRAVVLVGALAAHDILAKYLYAHPPTGITSGDAETGAMIMYYGGDAVDVALMVLLCATWYRAAGPDRGPRLRPTAHQPTRRRREREERPTLLGGSGPTATRTVTRSADVYVT